MTVQVNPLTIAKMAEDAYANAVDKGFHHNEDGSVKEVDFGTRIALIHSEVSEALEEDRKGHAFNHIYYREKDNKPEGILIELADAIIRIGDLAGKHDCADRLENAVKEKMAFNKTRPHMHGKEY